MTTTYPQLNQILGDNMLTRHIFKLIPKTEDEILAEIDALPKDVRDMSREQIDRLMRSQTKL